MESDRTYVLISQKEADARDFADPEFARAYAADDAEVELFSIEEFQTAEAGMPSSGSEFYSELMEAGRVQLSRAGQGHEYRVRFDAVAESGPVHRWMSWLSGRRKVRTLAPLKFYAVFLDTAALAVVRVHKEGPRTWSVSSSAEAWPLFQKSIEDRIAR